MSENTATNVTDIVLPVEVVTLKHLRTAAGEPVRVRCECINELALVEILQALPGARPDTGPDVSGDDPIAMVKKLASVAPALIGLGTALDGPDGEVRPAFYWDGTARHPLSIPGRMLREEDILTLVVSLLKLGGYTGVAAGPEFSDEWGAGADGGVGTVAAGEGDGTDPVAGTP